MWDYGYNIVFSVGGNCGIYGDLSMVIYKGRRLTKPDKPFAD